MAPSFASVDELNKHLATRSYVSGYSFSGDDAVALKALKSLPAASSHPHAYRWAVHILALTGNSASFLGGSAAPASSGAKGGAAAKKAAADDDEIDMGFDDDEPAAKKDDDIYDQCEEGDADEQAAAKARRERMAAAAKLKEAADAKSGKKKAEKGVEKSLVVLEVKPWEADTNLEELWKMIIAQEQEGLSWGQTFKLEPVAYGIMKLVMTCTIVDSLVLMDDITDKIEGLEDFVQSVQVASMNKL